MAKRTPDRCRSARAARPWVLALALIGAALVPPLVPRRAAAEPASAGPGVGESGVAAAPAPREASSWCIDALVPLQGDVCWSASPAARPADGAAPRRRTLVIFLHGLLDDGHDWQHPMQRGMLAMAKHHDFAMLAPRGLNGVGPGSLPRQIAWPARQDVRAEEDALLAKIMRARREAEVHEGSPYDEVFVLGFSNGAYYASSLALRGRLADVDGYAVIAGGSARTPPSASGAARKPVFVGVASADRTTVQRSRELVRALARSGWPYRAVEAKVGHTVADVHLSGALRWLRARAAGEPDPPLATSASKQAPPKTSRNKAAAKTSPKKAASKKPAPPSGKRARR